MSDDEPRIWYVMVAGKGKQSGPFTWGEVRHWVAQGKLLPQDFCWKEGMEDWVPLFSSGIDTLGQAPRAEETPERKPAPRGGAKHALRIAVPLVLLVLVGVVAIRSPLWAAFTGRFRERVDEIIAEEAEVGPGSEKRRTPEREQVDLEEELARLKRRAQAAVDASDWRSARRLWGDVAEKAGTDPALADEVKTAEAWVRWADLTERPRKRFTVLGVTIGARTVVRIRDTRDQKEYGVRVGDEFSGYMLESYDTADKSAQILSGGRSYRIEPPARDQE